MAEIRVERQNYPKIWLWWALIVAGIVLALGYSTNWFGLANPRIVLYDPQRPVTSLRYEDSTWVPRGTAVDFPDEQMVVVGTSPQGHVLYANKEQGYRPGGGGGELTPTTEPQAYGRIYVKTVDGRYQPFFMQR